MEIRPRTGMGFIEFAHGLVRFRLWVRVHARESDQASVRVQADVRFQTWVRAHPSVKAHAGVMVQAWGIF